jgi:hypothetical protein
MLDRSQQFSRHITSSRVNLSPADPHRPSRETQTVEAHRPPKESGIAVSANVGEDARGNAFRRGIVRTAPREELRGYVVR